MGSNYSQQISENTQKVINESYVKVTTKVANENQQYNNMFNNLVVDLTGASAVGCTFNISQENLHKNWEKFNKDNSHKIHAKRAIIRFIFDFQEEMQTYKDQIELEQNSIDYVEDRMSEFFELIKAM
jgi:predicted DNA-binding WGR domain protein